MEQFLSAVVDALLRLERGFGRVGVELRFLQLLGNGGVHGSFETGVGLLKLSLARLRLARKVLVFQRGQKLAFPHTVAAPHFEFRDGRRDFGRNRGLLKRINHGFGGNGLRDGRTLRRSNPHSDNRVFLLLFLAAANQQEN